MIFTPTIKRKKTLIEPPFQHEIPGSSWFRVAEMPADASYPNHSHPWAEFVYSYSGVMEVLLESDHLSAPAHYGIWLPPNVVHKGLNRYAATHCSFYLMPELCHGMPKEPCTLEVTPLVVAILIHLREHPLSFPPTVENTRLLDVLRDQLCCAKRKANFLPWSDDPQLSMVLETIECNPADNTPIAQLAAQTGLTVRTLNRKSQEHLGIPLNEWRQRLRVVRAMQLLEQGEKVESVAFEVGYNSASAFIAMFHRLTGKTPGDRENSV